MQHDDSAEWVVGTSDVDEFGLKFDEGVYPQEPAGNSLSNRGCLPGREVVNPRR